MVVAAALILGLAACSSSGSADDGGDAAPLDEIEIQPLDDREAPPLTLDELMDGRPMVVNFFSSTCTPCIEEMPDFETVHQDLGDEVTFVGLAPEGPERALGVVEATGVTYPTFQDTSAVAVADLGGVALPTTVFLHEDGTVAEVTSRALTESSLRDVIDEHFEV